MSKDQKIPNVPDESLSVNLKKMLADMNCICPGYWGQIGTVYMDRDTLPKTVSQLFWIVKQVLEANVEMQENFEELYKFVHDFFENLNLQEEVNKKLEEMLEDGSLTDALMTTIFKYFTKEEKIYHVSVLGSDESGDGTEQKPYRTIQYAYNQIPEIITEQQTIYVHNGVYNEIPEQNINEVSSLVYINRKYSNKKSRRTGENITAGIVIKGESKDHEI